MSVEWGQGLSRNRARYQSRCHFWARISQLAELQERSVGLNQIRRLQVRQNTMGWDELMSISSEEGLQSHFSLFLADEVDLLVDISI